MDEFLTALEKDKLAVLTGDKDMLSAIEKVMLFSMYKSGAIMKGQTHDPKVNWALHIGWNDQLSLEQKGSMLNAVSEGVRLVSQGIDMIKTFAPKKEEKPLVNKAR